MTQEEVKMDLEVDIESKPDAAEEIDSCQSHANKAEMIQVEAGCTRISRICLKSESKKAIQLGMMLDSSKQILRLKI